MKTEEYRKEAVENNNNAYSLFREGKYDRAISNFSAALQYLKLITPDKLTAEDYKYMSVITLDIAYVTMLLPAADIDRRYKSAIEHFSNSIKYALKYISMIDVDTDFKIQERSIVIRAKELSDMLLAVLKKHPEEQDLYIKFDDALMRLQELQSKYSDLLKNPRMAGLGKKAIKDYEALLFTLPPENRSYPVQHHLTLFNKTELEQPKHKCAGQKRGLEEEGVLPQTPKRMR